MRRSLAAFLPRTLWPLVTGGGGQARLEGAVLFADLAGFTRLTENLARIGHEGAEELNRICNAFFAKMITVVHEEGGDVLRFGGDAMTLFFPGGAEGGLRAAQRMQAEAEGFRSIETRAGLFELTMKIGISTGSLLVGTVGDGRIGYDYFAAGDALDLAAEAEHHAKKSQIALCPKCAQEMASGGIPVSVLQDGFGLVGGSGNSEEVRPGAHGRERRAEAPTGSKLATFLPAFIAERLSVAGGLAVAEHRRTTVLFLSFKGIDYEADPKAAEKVRSVYAEIASSVKKHGGFVNKLDMGDKGSKALCLFGTPHALEDQEAMACGAAMEIFESPVLRGTLTEARIGITASRLFAAYVGSDERREYTVMGDGINLAARLMGSAHAWRTLASEEVAREAASVISFRPLDPIFVKGKADKVAIFRPEGEKEAGAAPGAGFVGRVELISEVLPELSDTGCFSAFAITGEPGVGKSALLHRLGQSLDEAGIRHVTVPLVSYSAQTYLAAFIGVVYSCIGAGRGDDPDLKAEALKQALPLEDREFLPLFNLILGLNLPETEATSALEAKDRKDVTFAMLSRLIQGQAAERPYGVFLDHLEYADPASLDFLQVLVAEAARTPLKLLTAFRSTAGPSISGAMASARTVQVPPLDTSEVTQYLVQVAGFASPPEAFLAFLMQKTRGNPKFLEQMLEALKKAGLVAPGPSGFLEVDEDRLAATSFPDTLEGLLLARVDDLAETQRQLLKAASVLGDSFSVNLLRGLVGKPMEAVQDELLGLAERGFVKMDTWGERPYARFTDSLLRDALYGSLTFATKRASHRQVAELLEQEGAGISKLWPHLAQHFDAAGEEARAMHYLWLSAEEARARYDNLSAFSLLGRYVALAEKAGAKAGEDGTFRKALLYLAEACKELGRMEEADNFSRRIVDEAAFPCPERVIARLRMAEITRRRGQLKEALDLQSQALVEAKAMEDLKLQCGTLLDMGVPHAMMGRMDEAMGYFKQAEAIARKIKANISLANALMNQGLCHYHSGGRYEEALSALRRARRVAAAHELRPNLVLISLNLAQVLFDLGDYRKALEIAREGLAISKQFGYRNLYAINLCNSALYLTMLGRWDEAVASANAASGTVQHYQMQYLLGTVRHTQGILQVVSGDYEGALGRQNEAIQLHLKAHAAGDALADLNEILALANQLGLPEMARQGIEENAEALREEIEQAGKARSIAFRAQKAIWQHQEGEIPYFEAWQNLEKAFEASEKLGSLWLVAEVGEALVRFLHETRKTESAVVTGLRIFPMVMHHTSPLKVAPFLLVFGEVLLETDRKASLKAVLRLLKRYERSLDRGLMGIRYQLLLSETAVKDRQQSAASKHLRQAAEASEALLAGLSNEEIKRAFLALPEIHEVLKVRQGGAHQK